MRTYVYIDGLNLYHRAVKYTRWKWLDVFALCKQALKPHHRILKIKYFSARVLKTAHDPRKPERQNTYLRALQHTHPEKLEIHLGHFLIKPARFPSADPAQKGRIVEVMRLEEKGSDVNLAVHLLNDAWKDRYDCAVLITNDSDMAEGMRLTKLEHPQKRLGLMSPARRRHSRALHKQADFFIRLEPCWLRGSQLPDPIPGVDLRKPASW